MGVIATKGSRFKGDSTVLPAFIRSSLTHDPDLQDLRHAASLGAPQRLKGVEKWNGQWNEYGFYPTWYPGEEVTFIGSLDGTADDKDWSGDALVTQTVITIPVGENKSPTVVGTFQGIAALAKNNNTGVSVPASPSAISSTENLCVKLAALAGSPSYADQEGTNEIVITLSIEPKEFNHCGTSGYADAIEGNWDAQIQYKRYVSDLSTLPDEGVGYHVKVPIGGGQHWLFEYLRVGTLTGIDLDRESGDLLNVTIPMHMSIIESISGTATVGSGVTKPSGSVWRPTES